MALKIKELISLNSIGNIVQAADNKWQQGTHLRFTQLQFAALTLPQLGSAQAGPCAKRYENRRGCGFMVAIAE